MIVNKIPAPTWNFLRMNDATVEDVKLHTVAKFEADIPTGIMATKQQSFSLDGKTGLGEEMAKLVAENAAEIDVLSVAADIVVDEPARLTFAYENNGTALNAFELRVEDKAEMTVVMDFTSDKTASGDAGILTRYEVGNEAKLTLIQIQRLGSGYRFLNDIGGTVGEKGSFDLVQIVLGGKATYMGAFTALPDRKANLNTDIAYLLKDDETLDMNYVADHTGRKTTCDIKVSGVLRDRSQKLFRGTIDFHRGCGGSVGAELEDVLLMDETVRNKTIPIILCDEEDVEGAHGASIGKVDENVLFYLRSRGISEEEIYEMMARAKVETVLSKVKDLHTAESVRRSLGNCEKQGE